MSNRLFLALACVLCLVRLPSLVEPMGADQGLYAYVGERILAGDLPYRDAWDQKPPAIHFTYALMRLVWPHDSVVAAVDLGLAMVAAALVASLGASLAGAAVGRTAALLLLFLGNPAFLRLSGVMIRAQAETFVGALVAGALVLVAFARDGDRATVKLGFAGLLLGVAFTFKYNTAVYWLVAALLLGLSGRITAGALAALAAGFAIPAIMFLLEFGSRHAIADLYQATIAYNLRYSGETYAGPMQPLVYLLTFPLRHARVDGLWLVGCGGCAVLLLSSPWDRLRLLPVAWVAAACVAIAVNGSRDLPQYFIQAAPALALAAAWAGHVLWSRQPLVNAASLVLVGYGVWRVDNFQKLADNTWHDAQYAAGRTTRDDHLARYGEPGERKYSAILVERLAEHLKTHTADAERVYIFGFSCGAYVKAERASASRFFWSRPVIAGFNEGVPGYGAAGVLADLQRTPPAIVALQQVDWLGDVDNSAHYFTTHPLLGPWLRANYVPSGGPAGFDVWARRVTP
jgi:hypothetical protein